MIFKKKTTEGEREKECTLHNDCMFIKFHNQCVNLFDSHKAILKSINSSSHHSVTVDTLLSEGRGGVGGGG